MGTSICLYADRTCISSDSWHHLYERTLTVLRRWPDPPLRPRYRDIAGVQVIVHTPDVEDPDHWQICGDARSRLLGESIELPRDFGVEHPRLPPQEIVLRAIDPKARGLHSLLSNNTHGRPYHALVTAIAMLIEYQFPHATFIRGDIRPKDVSHAEIQLETILGERIPAPLVMDPPRLRARLRPSMSGDALEDTVRGTCVSGYHPPDLIVTDLQKIIGRTAQSQLDEELDTAVQCLDVSLLGTVTREAIEIFVEHAKWSAQRLNIPAQLACDDPRQLLQRIARSTKAFHLVLTEAAWTQLQHAASMAELGFLATTAMLQPTGLIGYNLSRALFESEAIREFAMQTWAATPTLYPGHSNHLPS